MIAGLEKTPVTEDLFRAALRFHLERTGPMTIFTAALSNLVSNVPAVLVFKSLVPRLPDPSRAWLTLAMASTLAGNLTLLGSVANLIVVQRARPRVTIGFWEYARTGLVVSAATMAFGVWWLG